MTTDIPTNKRRRGGQPNNQNAKNNRGNRTARRHRFAKGNRLGGAPRGNHNARRRRAIHLSLLQTYGHDAEAAAWIEANAESLDAAGLKEDYERDRALFDGWRGLTPEEIAANGREYELGLYDVISEGDSDQGLAA